MTNNVCIDLYKSENKESGAIEHMKSELTKNCSFVDDEHRIEENIKCMKRELNGFVDKFNETLMKL